jgi:carboxyl-terminal processing protease
MSLKKIRQYLLYALIALVFLGVGMKIGERKTGYVSVGGEVREIDTTMMNEVLDRLKQSYLKPEDIQSKKLMYGAAEGMTASLGDPYTAFYPPVENSRSKEDLQGEFGGVGIQLGYVEETLAVMAPLKGTPAEKAGIKAGDLILRIKDEAKKIDEDTSGIKIDDAVDMIRGLKGTTVVLTMFREGEKQSKEVSLVRDVINVPSTELSWVDND